MCEVKYYTTEAGEILIKCAHTPLSRRVTEAMVLVSLSRKTHIPKNIGTGIYEMYKLHRMIAR